MGKAIEYMEKSLDYKDDPTNLITKGEAIEVGEKTLQIHAKEIFDKLEDNGGIDYNSTTTKGTQTYRFRISKKRFDKIKSSYIEEYTK